MIPAEIRRFHKRVFTTKVYKSGGARATAQSTEDRASERATAGENNPKTQRKGFNHNLLPPIPLCEQKHCSEFLVSLKNKFQDNLPCQPRTCPVPPVTYSLPIRSVPGALPSLPQRAPSAAVRDACRALSRSFADSLQTCFVRKYKQRLHIHFHTKTDPLFSYN